MKKNPIALTLVVLGQMAKEPDDVTTDEVDEDIYFSPVDMMTASDGSVPREQVSVLAGQQQQQQLGTRNGVIIS